MWVKHWAWVGNHTTFTFINNSNVQNQIFYGKLIYYTVIKCTIILLYYYTELTTTSVIIKGELFTCFMCDSVANWRKVCFSRHFVPFLHTHKKMQNSDQIRFLGVMIFYNSDFIISKYKAKEWKLMTNKPKGDLLLTSTGLSGNLVSFLNFNKSLFTTK